MRAERVEAWSKTILAICGLVLIFTGLGLFLLPEYGAENFAWQVSPFLSMTIGGWSLGLGVMALDAARGWASNGLSRVYASVVAVWFFAVLQMLVVIGFYFALRTDHLLTYPYLLALLLGSLSAVLGAPILWGRRQLLATQGDGTPVWLRATYGLFVVVTLVLALAAFFIAPGRTAHIVPEPLSAFSADAFAAFLVALAAGALPLAFSHDPEPAAQYARAGLFPDILTLAAALSFSSTFDFAATGAWLYIAAYVVVAIVALGIAWWHRRSLRPVTWRH